MKKHRGFCQRECACYVIYMKLIKEFDGFKAGYGRVGTIAIIKARCHVCEEEKACLYTDGSEGEYGGVKLCRECLNNMFDSVDT